MALDLYSCHAALAGGATGAAAQSADLPKLHTHQSYMEEVMRSTALDVKDPLADWIVEIELSLIGKYQKF
jgi:hypothetical protein